MMKAQWIWLPAANYPAMQRATFAVGDSGAPYGVAAFRKDYGFAAQPTEVTLRVSGDTTFRLFADGAFVGCGPASAGGDFLTTGALPWVFLNTYTLHPAGASLALFAEVQLGRQVLTEFTSTEGGFYLEGVARFADGHEETFGSDASWLCRAAREYPAAACFDNGAQPDAWCAAEPRERQQQLREATIPMLDFRPVACGAEDVALVPGESYTFLCDRIYAATPVFAATDACEVRLTFFELPEQERRSGSEHVTFRTEGSYRSFRLYSVGGFHMQVLSAAPGARLGITLWDTHYPVTAEPGHLLTSDPALDEVYDTARHTLMICRQTMHLDSPLHQELLACTGDYYIEMLMGAFTFGDLRLAALDLVRTAWWLEANDGRMFHTTYSLIWVQMLWKYYMLTGDPATVRACYGGMRKLFRRFESYLGSNGVLENAPDYMFVDWVVTEGYSMHHPPKCLGQTVLNAFYYQALTDGCKLAEAAGWAELEHWQAARAAFKPTFLAAFWHAEANMFVDGLPTGGIPGEWQPENRPITHYSRYTAALAVLYDLAPAGQEEHLLWLAADDQSGLAPVQPYFMHFVLEAVAKMRARERYAMPLLAKWKPMVAACNKGLSEGWIKPEEGYAFDHSHAWGGAPACFLPQMLLGLEVLAPGMTALSLDPALLGLERADIAVPTPCGMLRVTMEQGHAPHITCPEGIRLVVKGA